MEIWRLATCGTGCTALVLVKFQRSHPWRTPNTGGLDKICNFRLAISLETIQDTYTITMESWQKAIRGPSHVRRPFPSCKKISYDAKVFKFDNQLEAGQYTYTNHVWDLWGCWYSTVHTVIYPCDLDHISCIHRCFAVLIWESKLLAVWLCDNEPFVFNVIKFYLSCSFSIIPLLYSILFVVLPFMVK